MTTPWLCEGCNQTQVDAAFCPCCGIAPHTGKQKACNNCGSIINALDIYCVQCSKEQEAPLFSRGSIDRALKLGIDMLSARRAIAAKTGRGVGVPVGKHLMISNTQLLECLSAVRDARRLCVDQSVFVRAVPILCGWLGLGDPYLPGQSRKGARLASKSLANWWNEYTGDRALRLSESRSLATNELADDPDEVEEVEDDAQELDNFEPEARNPSTTARGATVPAVVEHAPIVRLAPHIRKHEEIPLSTKRLIAENGSGERNALRMFGF